MVTEDIKKINTYGARTAANLTKEESLALEKFKENEQIIIKSSHKGNNIVIQNKNDYKEMVLKLLRDTA